ncbi:MAG: nucleoside recognition protein, partial [Desulfatitalea sp.]|nr:nucleoside recognition protein [Desulfatitalea sp.]
MGRKGRPSSKGRSLAVALVLSAAMLAAGLILLPGIDAATVGRKVALPLMRLLVVITLGLAVGQTIEAAGWTRALGILGAPLFRFARLGPQCSATFTTAFFSGAAANAMLFDFFQEGKIDRSQLFLTNLANQLPAFFLHLPTTVFIVLPLTGWAGGYYFTITFLAALARFFLVLVVGRLRPKQHAGAGDSVSSARRAAPADGGILQGIKTRLPVRLMGVATYVVPIYTAVALLNMAGLFTWTQQW